MSAHNDEKPVVCPKCGSESGDDWGQCGRKCPMPMSPHFDYGCADEHRTKALLPSWMWNPSTWTRSDAPPRNPCPIAPGERAA